jgi:hypothetical protein
LNNPSLLELLDKCKSTQEILAEIKQAEIEKEQRKIENFCFKNAINFKDERGIKEIVLNIDANDDFVSGTVLKSSLGYGAFQ